MRDAHVMSGVDERIAENAALRAAQEHNARREPSMFRDMNARRLAGLQAERRAEHEAWIKAWGRSRLPR